MEVHWAGKKTGTSLESYQDPFRLETHPMVPIPASDHGAESDRLRRQEAFSTRTNCSVHTQVSVSILVSRSYVKTDTMYTDKGPHGSCISELRWCGEEEKENMRRWNSLERREGS